MRATRLRRKGRKNNLQLELEKKTNNMKMPAKIERKKKTNNMKPVKVKIAENQLLKDGMKVVMAMVMTVMMIMVMMVGSLLCITDSTFSAFFAH